MIRRIRFSQYSGGGNDHPQGAIGERDPVLETTVSIDDAFTLSADFDEMVDQAFRRWVRRAIVVHIGDTLTVREVDRHIGDTILPRLGEAVTIEVRA